MTSWRRSVQARTGEEVLARARVCASFWPVFRGLQFTRPLEPNTGLLFDVRRESRSETAIHMFNVFYPIGVLWLSADGEVVHSTLARPWRPYYGSPKPARYFIEALPDILERAVTGDVLRIDEVVP